MAPATLAKPPRLALHPARSCDWGLDGAAVAWNCVQATSLVCMVTYIMWHNRQQVGGRACYVWDGMGAYRLQHGAPHTRAPQQPSCTPAGGARQQAMAGHVGVALASSSDPCVPRRAQDPARRTWNGWSRECLHDWLVYIQVAIPSMVMICLVRWPFAAGRGGLHARAPALPQ